MECKNCETTLKETANFCDECGGKVIKHRLNFKTVTAEFLETFISWDNKFFKTFTHLLTKPQIVNNGYLDGVRKRYMQPFSYMLIALSIYGIYMVLSKNILIEYLNEMGELMKNMPTYESNPKLDKFNTKMFNTIFKYNNFFTLSSIPLLAFINKLIFKERNFIEHNIALFYSYATFLLLSSIIGLLGILLHINYGIIYSVISLLMVVYHIYFYKKIFQLDIGTTILKTLYFWMLVISFFIIIGILIMILSIFFISIFKNH